MTSPADEEPTAIPIEWWRLIETVAALADAEGGASKPWERLRQAIMEMKAALGFQAATVYLRDSEADSLREKLVIGDKVELVDFLSFGSGPGVSGWTMHEGRPLLLAHRRESSREGRDCTFGTFVSLPLVLNREVLGVLNLGYDREQAISPPQVALMSTVVALVALLIQQALLRANNDHLKSELTAARQQLHRAHEGLTALKKVAQAARTAEAVVHGINNPLAVILGNAQCLIAERAAPNQKALTRLRRIEEAAQEVAKVNRHLLRIHSMADDVELAESGKQFQELTK
ncbi:MAG: GAF domain-containing protein [bacterium]